MQALILAAGMAERLRPLTLNHPKCLVEIGGKTFMERMITNLLKHDIRDINIITGFQVDKLKSYVGEKFPELSVNYYHNDRYFETNNSYSLWLAKHLIREDFLLFDADIIFDHRILDLLLNSEHSDCLALRTAPDLGEEEMKVRVDDRNRVLEISKTIAPHEAAGESLGIEKFSKDMGKLLFDKLEHNILSLGGENDFYEKSFEDIISDGANLYAIDVGDYRCAEVDFAEDILHVEREILPHIE